MTSANKTFSSLDFSNLLVWIIHILLSHPCQFIQIREREKKTIESHSKRFNHIHTMMKPISDFITQTSCNSENEMELIGILSLSNVISFLLLILLQIFRYFSISTISFNFFCFFFSTENHCWHVLFFNLFNLNCMQRYLLLGVVIFMNQIDKWNKKKKQISNWNI